MLRGDPLFKVYLLVFTHPKATSPSRQVEHLRHTGNIIHMIAQRDEQIKEQLSASSLHFQLHGPAALERASASDYEGQVMGS